jgi:hypothetical protein
MRRLKLHGASEMVVKPIRLLIWMRLLDGAYNKILNLIAAEPIFLVPIMIDSSKWEITAA